MKKDDLFLYALQLKNNSIYQNNLDKILYYLQKLPKNSVIVAPEVALTDYDYSNLKDACSFSEYALSILLTNVKDQILVLTILREIEGDVVNQAVVIHNGEIVHTQNKHKLFKLGDEHLHLKAGCGENIVKFSINGVSFGVLICFELRFKELWEKLEGSDVILVPSQWGEPRKRHLEILSQSLAVMNQCYVVVANSSKESMAKSSAVYSPLGGAIINDFSEVIESKVDFKEIKFMRRYLKLH